MRPVLGLSRPIDPFRRPMGKRDLGEYTITAACHYAMREMRGMMVTVKARPSGLVTVWALGERTAILALPG